MNTDAENWITPSHLLQYLYCPRFTYFEYVLGLAEHQELRHKVMRGREVHEERTRVNARYLRSKIGVIARENDVELNAPRFQIRGRVDEVLTLDDGTMAPLDYKYAEWKGRVFINQKVQAAMYGIMIREVYGHAVDRAFLCHTRSNYRIEEITLDGGEYDRAFEMVDACRSVMASGVYPPATSVRARCADCCYRNICIQ